MPLQSKILGVRKCLLAKRPFCPYHLLISIEFSCVSVFDLLEKSSFPRLAQDDGSSLTCLQQDDLANVGHTVISMIEHMDLRFILNIFSAIPQLCHVHLRSSFPNENNHSTLVILFYILLLGRSTLICSRVHSFTLCHFTVLSHSLILLQANLDFHNAVLTSSFNFISAGRAGLATPSILTY